ERYAISLPDIEAYIEQKIPVEPVTPDLLVAQPRKPRAAAADEEGGESVSDIFREAREQRAADEERRGGGRKAGGRSGGAGTGSSGSGGSRDSRSRGPRKPRAADAEGPQATAVAASAAPTSAAAAPSAVGEHAPRMRRRRRGGKRVD